MLNCIIVDDETLALDLLEDNIKHIPYLNLVARCNNANEALLALQTHEIDLLVTDIQMPGINGMQLLRGLTKPPMVIIITAFENHAVESYDLEVIDYLLKPVSFERFSKAVNKAYDRSKTNKAGEGPTSNTSRKDYVFLNADYSTIKVNYKDVLFIEGVGDYVKIHFLGKKAPLLIRMYLKNMEELINNEFFIRIHKSYIVNKDYITHIRKGIVHLEQLELPISNAYKDTLQAFVENNK